MPSAYLENRPCLIFIRRMHEHGDKWYDPVRLEVLQNIWWHHSPCHPAGGYGCYDIAQYIVFVTLLCKRLRESNLGKLGGRVVALAKTSEQTCSGGCVDDSAILLLPKIWPRSSSTLGKVISVVNYNETKGMTYFVSALHVDFDDKVPVIV